MIDLIPIKYRIAAGMIAGALALAAAAFGGWTVRGFIADADMAAVERDSARQREEAIGTARQTEHRQQESINEILRTQNAALAGTADRLRLQLDGLRNRPERPAGMPAAPRPACAGGSGAELSRADAEFLAREAARADDIRAGLVGCYQVIDAAR